MAVQLEESKREPRNTYSALKKPISKIMMKSIAEKTNSSKSSIKSADRSGLSEGFNVSRFSQTSGV